MMQQTSRLSLLILAFLIALPSCRRHESANRPSPDGYYRIPLTDNPLTLDPARFTDVNSAGVAARIFSTLVKLDARLRPAPDLAQSWKVSEDGLTWTFTLRKGVTFHNGRPATSGDVRYSFERLLGPATASHRAWILEPISGAREMREGKAASLSGLETPDPLTVVLRLREPFGPFLLMLAMPNAAVVPREEVVKGDVPFGRRPVGTGPFRFVRWRDNDALELARNEDYFAGPAKLAGLRFRVNKE
jgi:ABC-type transport system substrate-binding protein